MAIVLNDAHDHEGSHRTVLISGYFAHEISELDAKMYVDSCTLVRFTETEMPVRFRIGAADMDVLVEEWQNFKAARTEYLEKEKQQEADSIAEALRLAQEHGFEIDAQPGNMYLPCWKGGTRYTRGYIYGSQLLACVQEMVAMTEEAKA